MWRLLVTVSVFAAVDTGLSFQEIQVSVHVCSFQSVRGCWVCVFLVVFLFSLCQDWRPKF